VQFESEPLKNRVSSERQIPPSVKRHAAGLRVGEGGLFTGGERPPNIIPCCNTEHYRNWRHWRTYSVVAASQCGRPGGLERDHPAILFIEKIPPSHDDGIVANRSGSVDAPCLHREGRDGPPLMTQELLPTDLRLRSPDMQRWHAGGPCGPE